jgi:membrane-bound lytic murein transglycosylase D
MQWFQCFFGINRKGAKLILAALFFYGLYSTSFAQTIKSSSVYRSQDTTAENDQSLINTLAPKQSFINYTHPVQVALNPMVTGFVQQYATKQSAGYEKMKSWGKPYFDMYDQILPQYGVPKELKYLSVIESYLQPSTISWAGAVGPWQLMDYEGKRYGLRMNSSIDERMDFYKSTHAACKLIKELYETFGDWLLVIAAYNGGVGRVKQCIKKANGSRSFWDIQYFLPEETRTHVKKYIATHYIFEGSGGWTTMTAAETNQYIASIAANNQQPELTNEEINNSQVIEVSGRYSSTIITNSLVMNIGQFNKWNPQFDKTLAEGKKYQMRLSNDKINMFESKKDEILLASIKALLN